MSGLVPTKYSNDVLGPYPAEEPFCTAATYHVVECGWHTKANGEDLLLERIEQTVTPYGHILHREEEYWTYAQADSPPLAYVKRTYGHQYLPEVNTGRAYILLEEEKATFYPWTSFQTGLPNLSSIRTFKGWVVYDCHQERYGDNLTPEEQAKLKEEDRYPVGPARRIVSSARTWREATDEGSIAKVAGAPQVSAKLTYKTITETVFEDPDKYLFYETEHIHIREGPPKTTGPRIERKEGFQYTLPYPVEPPTIEATVTTTGVRLLISGGGATVNGKRIQPTAYKVLRRVAVDGGRPPSGDPYDRYDVDPAPAATRQLVTDTAVEDAGGAPTSPLPGQTTYTEQGDATEEEGTAWAVIAELDNATPAEAVGTAETLDTDMVAGSTYDYAATALIGRDESEPSPTVSAAWGGTTLTSGIKVRVRQDAGTTEVDVLAPGDDDYGETVDYDLPLAPDDPEALGEEVGQRQFLRDQLPKLRVTATCSFPLLGLERGQPVKLPPVAWKLTGNGLVIDSVVAQDEWVLDGWRLRVTADPNGRLSSFNLTELELVEP